VKGFLFDENLPRQIEFRPSLPVIHATEIGVRCSDGRLWQFARENDLAIVSKDIDFSQRVVRSKPLPWVIHLRMGNPAAERLGPLFAADMGPGGGVVADAKAVERLSGSDRVGGCLTGR
jgi:predicted nuclease of predicted toxin-antitoxin system